MPDTSVSTIPTLTDDEIQARVGLQSFQRGKQYFHDRAIIDARQQGMSLKARCLGSRSSPYRLVITFGPDGLSVANCSCPVGAGGYCKHIAALLLTWRERPQEFLAMEEQDTTLERRSKEDLIALVKQMLRQDPELETLLDIPLPTGERRPTPVDSEIYRRQAAAVFFQTEEHWETPGDVAQGLLAITSIGDGFARQQDYASAAAVYGAVALESLQHFESYHEESGAMVDVISECIDDLGECLAKEHERTVRERIVRTLFEVYRFDVDFGGVGLSDEVPGLLLDHATPEERRTVAGWVRESIPQGGGSTTTWRRHAYGGFLLDLELDTLDDEAFLQVCRETGRVHDLADRLLSLGRAEEAVKAVQGASDYDLLYVTPIFDRYERGDLADRLMVERSQTTQDTRILDWLKDRSKTRGDTAAALDLSERLFRMRPDLTRYRELRELGRQTGAWETMRPQVLTILREQRWNDLLVAIHLDEGEIDQALEVLRNLGSDLMGYSYGLYGKETLALQVARAAAETRPRAALEIYRQQVEHLIGVRNRGSYGEAARLLVQVRILYSKLGESKAWSSYLEELRERYRSLRALKEELAVAGL
jgi:tetratricopeptide (TPR) repeat protein